MREAIVLAGGLGTRLRGVIGSELPKPMAVVAGNPFLHYLLEQLKRWNTTRVVLSVGYKYEVIKEHFGDSYLGMRLVYSVEHEPLGTGGGIRHALEMLTANSCFILNGDSYFDTSFDALANADLNTDMVMALKHVEKSSRYGTVQLDERNRVLQFNEKQYVEAGYINAGIYYTTKALLNKLPRQQKFSFEEDYLKPFVQRDNIRGVKSNGYFIDIGIPEDYNKADVDFATMF